MKMALALSLAALLAGGCVIVHDPRPVPPLPVYSPCMYPYQPVWMGSYWGCQMPWYSQPGFNLWFFWQSDGGHHHHHNRDRR